MFPFSMQFPFMAMVPRGRSQTRQNMYSNSVHVLNSTGSFFCTLQPQLFHGTEQNSSPLLPTAYQTISTGLICHLNTDHQMEKREVEKKWGILHPVSMPFWCSPSHQLNPWPIRRSGDVSADLSMSREQSHVSQSPAILISMIKVFSWLLRPPLSYSGMDLPPPSIYLMPESCHGWRSMRYWKPLKTHPRAPDTCPGARFQTNLMAENLLKSTNHIPNQCHFEG